MSSFLKSKIYPVKAGLLVECARAMRYRNASDHFIIGGMCTIITELLFTTYYIDDANDEYSVYSDSKVVSRRIPDTYADVAIDVILYRNKFSHEFGSTEYEETYKSVVGRMKDVCSMVHYVGGMPTKAEREFLCQYYGIELTEFYDKMTDVFMKVGPIGYQQLVSKIQRKL